MPREIDVSCNSKVAWMSICDHLLYQIDQKCWINCPKDMWQH
jgi:hypothetical protein